MVHEPVQLPPHVGQGRGRRVQVRRIGEPAQFAGGPQDRERGAGRRLQRAGEPAPARGQRFLEPARLPDPARAGDEDPGDGALDEVEARLGIRAGRGTPRVRGRGLHPVRRGGDRRVEEADLVDAGKPAQALAGVAPHREREQPHEPAPVAVLGRAAGLEMLDHHPRSNVAKGREDRAEPAAAPVLGFRGDGAEGPREMGALAGGGSPPARLPGALGRAPLQRFEAAAPADHRAVPRHDLEAHVQMRRQNAPQPLRRPGIGGDAHAPGAIEEAGQRPA